MAKHAPHGIEKEFGEATLSRVLGDVGGLQLDTFAGFVGGDIGFSLLGVGASVGPPASFFLQFEANVHIHLE